MHLQQFFRARQRIAGVAEETRCMYSEPLSNMAGANVYLKLETEQPTGAFRSEEQRIKLKVCRQKKRGKGLRRFRQAIMVLL